MMGFDLASVIAIKRKAMNGANSQNPNDGVQELAPHHDTRGKLVEIFRESWDLGCRAVQFNAVTT